jgi:hypothetical protein
MFKDSRGKWIRFGVGRPGGSDLIGWKKCPIIKDAIFLAVELKRPGKYPTKEQQNFIDQVNMSGGIAGVCRSVDDFINLIS